jgi:hypothetical protein
MARPVSFTTKPSFVKIYFVLDAGMAAYARSKEHDDRQCVNEGVALIMGRDDIGQKFFSNQNSGGTQLYRALGKTNAKETDSMIIETIHRIEKEAAELEDTELITSSGKKVQVSHKFLLTMLDGKCRYLAQMLPYKSVFPCGFVHPCEKIHPLLLS